MAVGWKDLAEEIRIQHRELLIFYAAGHYADAEIACHSLLELLRMAKRWKANGNKPPENLPGLLEGTYGDHA